MRAIVEWDRKGKRGRAKSSTLWGPPAKMLSESGPGWERLLQAKAGKFPGSSQPNWSALTVTLPKKTCVCTFQEDADIEGTTSGGEVVGSWKSTLPTLCGSCGVEIKEARIFEE